MYSCIDLYIYMMHDTKFSCARCDPGEALSGARIGLETSKASTAQESCAQECLENRFLRATVFSIAETLPSLQNQGSTGCQNSCAFLRVFLRFLRKFLRFQRVLAQTFLANHCCFGVCFRFGFILCLQPLQSLNNIHFAFRGSTCHISWTSI